MVSNSDIEILTLFSLKKIRQIIDQGTYMMRKSVRNAEKNRQNDVFLALLGGVKIQYPISISYFNILFWYSVWHLVVQILFKFFLSQNQFSLDWLNLDSNKNSFAHYILHRVQNFFYLVISLASPEKSGSEWGIIFP